MTEKNNKNSELEIQDSKISGNPRANEHQPSADRTRRTALLGAIGVAGAAGLPSEWKKPIIDGLLLPAHAQMSPTTSSTTTSVVTSNTTTSGTTIQTSTTTTQGTAAGTVLITSGTAACTAMTDGTTSGRITGQPDLNGQASSGYELAFKYTTSNQTLCEDNFSNTTLTMGSSSSGYYYSTFIRGGAPNTLPTGIVSARTTSYAPPLTNISYTISSSYTVSATTTISGTVTISG